VSENIPGFIVRLTRERDDARVALAAERARADQAEQRIADAPHADYCAFAMLRRPCTCWKSAAPTAEQ
jgi:hypothetical protein